MMALPDNSLEPTRPARVLRSVRYWPRAGRAAQRVADMGVPLPTERRCHEFPATSAPSSIRSCQILITLIRT